VECFVYLIENGCPWNIEYLAEIAADEDQYDMLVLLHQKGAIFTHRDLIAAMYSNNLRSLEYICDNIRTTTKIVIEDYMIKPENIECREYLRKRGVI
jgi:hypothetical protein